MNNMFFLGGLARSGNTLLSALLNQNPELYVSPLSPLLDNVIMLDKMLNIDEVSISVDFTINTNAALTNYVKGFYSHINKPFIIDRNKSWGSKESIYIAHKYFTQQPKVIFTVRDIPSILTSYIQLVDNEPNNYIDDYIRQNQTRPYGLQTQNDLRCDWLMRYQIEQSLSILTELLQIGIKVCLIEYDDLVAEPQNQLNKIYEYLELQSFVHDFNNIQKVETETLAAAKLPNNLHDVRRVIKKNDYKPVMVLSDITLRRYSNLEFWRN